MSLSTQFTVQHASAPKRTAVLDPGSAALPAIATSTTSGLYRLPQSDGVGLSVNGVPRVIASGGNVAVLGNVVTASRVLVGGGRSVDGLPARQPTWNNLGMYADPANLKVSLTTADIETYGTTVRRAGTVRQVTAANRPTYVHTDPIDAKPAIAFDRTALQSLSGSPMTLNCGTNGGFTSVIMMKATNVIESYETVYEFTSQSGTSQISLARQVATGDFRFQFTTNSSSAQRTIPLSQNQWSILACRVTVSGGTWTAQLFKDGVQTGAALTLSTPLLDTTFTTVGIGRSLYSTTLYRFTGSIRYLGVWDRPLSDAELAKVTEAARIVPDLQGVPPILRFLQGARDSCTVESAADALMPGPTGFAGLAGAVLLPDGRVFCPPYSGTTARLVDPRTNVVTTPTASFPSGGAFQGGILLPNGKVFLAPRNSTYAMLFDPATETVTTSAAVFPGANAYQGAVLLPDGKVYMTPYASTSALLYDYVTDTTSAPPGTFPATSFISCALTSDGKVLCIPYGSTTARVYDPISQTLSTPSGTFTGNYFGGVLLPDGRVFCCPYSATTARIYDPYTNTVSTPAGTYDTTGWNGGVRLPCGRVALIPYNNTNALIFDPATETISTPRGTIAAPSASYWGGILLPDGRVFMTPYSKTQAQYLVTGGFGFAPLPTNVLLSPWCNNNI